MAELNTGVITETGVSDGFRKAGSSDVIYFSFSSSWIRGLGGKSTSLEYGTDGLTV